MRNFKEDCYKLFDTYVKVTEVKPKDRLHRVVDGKLKEFLCLGSCEAYENSILVMDQETKIVELFNTKYDTQTYKFPFYKLSWSFEADYYPLYLSYKMIDRKEAELKLDID